MVAKLTEADVHTITLLGSRVKALRKSRGLTLGTVADRAGLAKSYVWELERGKNTNPSISTLMALARAFGSSLDELVGMDTFMKPQIRPEAMQIAVQVDAVLRAALAERESG
jgi:transcriptional regulator with XRE-family HTH domain